MEWLRIRGDGVYVDCTAGAGGHSARIAERLTTGRLIAIDRDETAVALTRQRLSSFSNATVVHGDYRELSAIMAANQIAGIDGVLVDAGVSSMQLDESARGFSFQQQGPLDMRMDASRGLTASEWLGSTDQAELARILRDHGDVKPAKRIAAGILKRLEQGRLETTKDLADAVREALPFVHRDPDEIRQVFQAVRIAVNDELNSLREGLDQAIDSLRPTGRLVAITFHSGEDRVVKNVFRDASRPHKILAPDGRVEGETPARLRVLTPSPITPTSEEIHANPRSKSAKLRAAEAA